MLLIRLACLACLAGLTPRVIAEDAPPILDTLAAEADSLAPLVSTPLARQFLDAVSVLPDPGTRTVLYNAETRHAMTPAQAEAMTLEELQGYESKDLDAEFYYTTRYGSPLAFVRTLELLGSHGLDSVAGERIADFGFGSMGQLHLLASLGAHSVGIEVDQLLEALYHGDQGSVRRASGTGEAGSVRLVFGKYPADDAVTEAVGTGYRVFVSKNTLKNGYIHPAEEVDPKMLVHLDVDDETFVRRVHHALVPGGLFLIYNLCPPQAEDRYIPWADGTSPFSRELFETIGFEVLAFNVDDTDAARAMGAALGWGEGMNLDTDLFGMYTLVRRLK